MKPTDIIARIQSISDRIKSFASRVDAYADAKRTDADYGQRTKVKKIGPHQFVVEVRGEEDERWEQWHEIFPSERRAAKCCQDLERGFLIERAVRKSNQPRTRGDAKKPQRDVLKVPAASAKKLNPERDWITPATTGPEAKLKTTGSTKAAPKKKAQKPEDKAVLRFGKDNPYYVPPAEDRVERAIARHYPEFREAPSKGMAPETTAAMAAIRKEIEKRQKKAERVEYKSAGATRAAKAPPKADTGKEIEERAAVVRWISSLKQAGTNKSSFDAVLSALAGDRSVTKPVAEAIASGYIGGRTKWSTRQAAIKAIEVQFLEESYERTKMIQVEKASKF